MTMPPTQYKPILGIIGGIGSGKTLVAAELAKHGGFLISGDRLGHEALLEPDLKELVLRRFGQDIADEQSSIDRRKLGARVFADRHELRALEDLVFPFIERRIGEEISLARQNVDVAFVVLDAAVMLEAGWGRVCDKLIFVDAPRHVRLERLERKHGWTDTEVAARERVQMDLSVKKARADLVIDNCQSVAAVQEQTLAILQRLGLTTESDRI
jgi:dephospho-CoA kinase